MWPPLIALFIAAFAFGSTEFVIAGILPQVADGLSVSIPLAGYLVTAYAVGITIGGPLFTILTSQISRKKLLVALGIVFMAGQIACALAPGFASMLAFRIVVAAAHGVFFGVAMVVAVRLVPAERRGMAVAFVLAGLTVSNILGVPAGTAIGNLFGWRATFWSMFGLGLIATGAIIVLLPRTGGPEARQGGLMREVSVLGRQQVWTSLIIMQMLMIGQFVPFTYIAPMLREVTGLPHSAVPLMLLLNGLGATAGVFVGGRLAGWKLMPSLITLLAVQVVILAAMYVFSPYALPMAAIVFLWGCVSFAIGTPIQTRILTWTADAPNLASSLIPAGFNIGIAISASIGSMLLTTGYGYRSLPVPGIFSMILGCFVALLSYMAERRIAATPPAMTTEKT